MGIKRNVVNIDMPRSPHWIKRVKRSLRRAGWLGTLAKIPRVVARRSINEPASVEAMCKIQAVCPESFLMFGTLIACMQGGRLFPWDHDMDFGILSERWDDGRIELLKKAGFTIDKHYLWNDPKTEHLVNKSEVGQTSKLRLLYRGRDNHICFNVMRQGINEERYFHVGGRSSVFHCPGHLLDRTRKVTFYSMPVNVPERAEEFLEFVYGPGWKVPKRKYLYTKEHEENRKRFMLNFGDAAEQS